MGAMTILYLIIAALIGAAMMYFGGHKTAKCNNQKEDSLLSEIEKLENCKKKISEKYELSLRNAENHSQNLNEQLIESLNEKTELKEKYETLLQDGKRQAEELDNQLKQSLNGKIDESVQAQLSSINELKNKINGLQEEIVEYKEDIDDFKERIEKKNIENSELRETIDKEKAENGYLKKELEEKESQLASKIESLSFIKEVLSAEQVNDDHTQDLYDKVNDVVDFVESDLEVCVRPYVKGKPCENIIWSQELKKWESTAKKSWIKNKTSIAFIGEFSAGKTSIVNRILSQDDPSVPRLPVSAKASTAIPTYISGGIVTAYQFLSPDNQLKRITEETFSRVDKEVLDQMKGISSLIQYFVMTYKNPHLEKQSILDTPGFSSNDTEDAKRTIEVINECDALFWVFDVNNGTVNASSLSIIKKHLRKPLYLIVNKVDTKSSSEVEEVESLIKMTFQEAGISVKKIIHFSAKAPLEDIMDPIGSVTQNIVKDEYIEYISSELDRLLDGLNDDCKQVNDELSEYNKEQREIEINLNNRFLELKTSCDAAAEIPQWTSHTFSKDRYEMNKEQGESLVAVLDEISQDQVENIKNLIMELTQIISKIEKKQSEYGDKRSSYNKVKDCRDKFYKLTSLLAK